MQFTVLFKFYEFECFHTNFSPKSPYETKRGKKLFSGIKVYEHLSSPSPAALHHAALWSPDHFLLQSTSPFSESLFHAAIHWRIPAVRFIQQLRCTEHDFGHLGGEDELKPSTCPLAAYRPSNRSTNAEAPLVQNGRLHRNTDVLNSTNITISGPGQYTFLW